MLLQIHKGHLQNGQAHTSYCWQFCPHHSVIAEKQPHLTSLFSREEPAHVRGLYFYQMDSWAALLQKEVQQFIVDNEFTDSRSLALKQKPFMHVSAQLLAAQLLARQKAKNKLPLFYKTFGIVYPPTLNLEQSSSEATAYYKAVLLASLVSNTFSAADLTGGFGVDSFFLSRVAKSLVHVEPNEALQKIVTHNHTTLGASNIRYLSAKAEAFLEQQPEGVDVYYIDPSRRKEEQKVFALADCEPNIIALQKTIFEQAPFLLLKAAPLLDIHQALKELHFVKKVFVVSVVNECKELLFWCERNFTEPCEIVSVNLHESGEPLSSYAFTVAQERSLTSIFSEPQPYLYEPNASILKAGAFKSIGASFNLAKLAPSTHLYTSSELVKNFPGRVFQVNELLKADAKIVHQHVPDKKANVLTRNYPVKAEELKKKLKLKDGGDRYLIAFSGLKTKHLALCSRVY